ncbi:MAG TPA: hypothetical protein VIM56_10145 [Rhizomicrobium sp.]
MNVFRLFCLGVIFVFSCAAAAPSLTPAQKSAICGKRSTCKLVTIHNAGKAQVAEVLFGIKDKPDNAPDDGCRTADGNDPKNGGTEYWLLSGASPTNILSLCNDGYGAADMGEDTVTFSNNRMVHVEAGGSSWRWNSTDTISLVPFQLLTQLSCSFHNIEPATGTVTFVDAVRFRAADIRKNPAANWGDDEDNIGCPEVSPSAFAKLKPIPGPKLVADYPVISPSNADDPALGSIPDGTTLGGCAMILSTDGANGFLTFGKPADAAHAASMKVLAVDSKRLLLQIYDPIAASAAAGKSWIGGAHAEIWHSESYDDSQPPDRSELRQLAVDLDGSVHLTGEAKAPQVKRWTSRDEKGRPVTVLLLTWADDLGETAVSYSQAENGKQARLVTTVAMARGVPMVMPSVAGMPTKCAIRGGRFELADVAQASR